MNVYKADVALLAGDLTGKAIVPIVQRDGRYETELFGVHRTARGDEELARSSATSPTSATTRS